MESFMMMRTTMVRMKKWQLVKIQLKTPDHLLPSRTAKSRNDQQQFLGSWWIVMKRRKNWTRGVKCSPNYIYSNYSPFYLCNQSPVLEQWRGGECDYSVRQRYHCNEFPDIGRCHHAATVHHAALLHALNHAALPRCHHAACHAAQHCSALNNTAVHNQFQCTVKTPAQCKQQLISLQCNVQKCAQCKLHSVHHANLCTACTIKMSLLYSRTSQ